MSDAIKKMKIERKKGRAIAVNNKPQYYKKQEIAAALAILENMDVQYFDNVIQKKHLIMALKTHLANKSSVSDLSEPPSSNSA